MIYYAINSMYIDPFKSSENGKPNQTLFRSSLGEEDISLFKWRVGPFFKGEIITKEFFLDDI